MATAPRRPQQEGGIVDEILQDEEGVEYSPLPDDTAPVEVATPADTKEELPATTTDDELPEQLRGKTLAEVAKMYTEAQGLIGRQGSELGDLRKRTDMAIAASLEALKQGRQRAEPAAAQPAPKTAAEQEADFYADPKKAIAEAIAAHPELQKLKGAAQQYAAREMLRHKAESQTLFDHKYPQASEILADPSFREWVGKSQYRKQMLARADRLYDVQAADEVFGVWAELQAARKPVVTPAEAEVKDTKKQLARRAANVPTGGNASPAESSGKKIYRRSEILDLMQNNPGKYELLADEIGLAYAEGRVR